MATNKAKKKDKRVQQVIDMEQRVLLGDTAGVEAAFSKNAPFLFTARAVAFAMRFRGPDMVRTLLDAGASLDYTLTPENSTPFDCRWGAGWARQLDFSKFLFPKAVLLDADARQIAGSKTLTPIGEQERLAVMQLLNERNIDGLHSFYYYSILYDDPAVTEYLRSVGINVLPSPFLDILTGKLRLNEIQTTLLDHVEDELRTQLTSADAASFSRIISGLYDAIHEKVPVFRYRLLAPKVALQGENFPLLLEKTDLGSKLRRWDIVRMLIELKNMSALDYVLHSSWTRNSADREFMLQLAREARDPSPEIVSLVLKSLEDESESDSIMDELSLEPKVTKPTDLKKIWSTRKQPNGTYELYSYKGTDPQVTVPDRIGDVEVTAIAPTTFQTHGPGVNARISSMRKNITSIEFPGTIKSIPNGLMGEDRGPRLETVIFNKGTTQIGKSSFQSCESLTEVTLPEGLRAIDAGAFEGCKALKHIEFGDELRNIKANAFRGSGLEEVKLPNNIREVGKEAFANCSALHSVEAPSRLKLSAGAFTRCPKLADANGCIVINHTLFGYEDPHGSANAMPDQLPPLKIGPDIITVSRPYTAYPTITYRPSNASGVYLDRRKFRLGERISFGRFPQDSSLTLKPIQWRVMSMSDDGIAILISDKALVFLPDLEGGLVWKDCRQCDFLNGPFMDVAFTDLERAQMNEFSYKCREYDPRTGKTQITESSCYVSVPDYGKVVGWYNSSLDIRARATEYAYEQTSWMDRDIMDLQSPNGYVDWGLLSPNGYNETLMGTSNVPHRTYSPWTVGQFIRPMIAVQPI